MYHRSYLLWSPVNSVIVLYGRGMDVYMDPRAHLEQNGWKMHDFKPFASVQVVRTALLLHSYIFLFYFFNIIFTFQPNS